MPDGSVRLPDWWNGLIEAISYQRFSSGRQAKGNSLDRQTDNEVAYIEKWGLRICDSFVDAGYSGFTGANSDIGALARLLKLAQSRAFKPGTHLIIEGFDRLSRADVRKAHRLFDDLISAGLVIHTIADEQVYWAEQLDADPIRLIISITIMIRSNEELKGKKLKSLDNRKRERDRAMTTATNNDGIGVPITKTVPDWIKVVIDEQADRAAHRKWHFELHPERTLVVRCIYEDAVRLGITTITKRLNRDGVETFNGAPMWSKGMVVNILRSDAVIGMFQPKRYETDRKKTGSRAKRGKQIPNGEPFPYFPPAISDDLFRQARAGLERRRNSRGRHGTTYPNLLKGLIQCGGDCKGPVHHQDRPGPHSYLKCKAAAVSACSNGTPYPYHRLEPVLYRLHELYRAIGNILPKQIDDTDEKIAALDNRIDRLRASRKRLYDRFADGEGDDDLDATLDRLRAQIDEATRQRDALEQAAKMTDADIENGYVARYTEARRRIELTDTVERLEAREAVADEYRRIIEVAILQPNRTMTVRLRKRVVDGIQIEYLLSPDRIEGWHAVMPNGTKLDAAALLRSRDMSVEEIAIIHASAMSHDVYEMAEAYRAP